MFKWLKKKPAAVKEEKIPYGLHVERRQHARIRYPRSGAMAELPFISFRGSQLEPLNLSMGGFLMSHATLNDLKAGEVYELTFKWMGSDREILQKSRLVRVTQIGCHFKFEDLNPQLLVNLSLALKPGVRAQKTNQ
ncbi:MAG TPA: PilZ domain-containing protein, partial [Bdellovibrionales bacterium]|nr:PilZ domain-containing protein [Bdellovibrionales bacterium]